MQFAEKRMMKSTRFFWYQLPEIDVIRKENGDVTGEGVVNIVISRSKITDNSGKKLYSRTIKIHEICFQFMHACRI